MTKGSLVKMLTGGGLLAVAALGIAVSGSALAQMTPQQQQQLPPSDPSSPQYHSVYLPSIGEGDTVRPSEWIDRWGAISDDGKGAFGIVSDMHSKRAAETNAINECKKRGGGRCSVSLAYRSQCAAVSASTSASYSSSAPSIEEARQRAMQRCNRESNDCWIYYSGCSLPVRAE